MGMITNRMVDELENSLSKTDGIYRLIEKTTNSGSQKVRIWAIVALGKSGDPRAVRSLIECCEDQSPEIRLHAIEGLQNLRSGRSVEVLAMRLRDKKELPEIRQRAATALATIRSVSALMELRSRHGDSDEDEALRTHIGGELDRVKLW
jgi:HEAT repeat protein